MFETDRFNVSALLDADGSAVILHAGRDNFANIPATYSSGDPAVPGPNAATLGTGDAGGRYACGVVRGRERADAAAISYGGPRRSDGEVLRRART